MSLANYLKFLPLYIRLCVFCSVSGRVFPMTRHFKKRSHSKKRKKNQHTVREQILYRIVFTRRKRGEDLSLVSDALHRQRSLSPPHPPLSLPVPLTLPVFLPRAALVPHSASEARGGRTDKRQRRCLRRKRSTKKRKGDATLIYLISHRDYLSFYPSSCSTFIARPRAPLIPPKQQQLFSITSTSEPYQRRTRRFYCPPPQPSDWVWTWLLLPPHPFTSGQAGRQEEQEFCSCHNWMIWTCGIREEQRRFFFF